MNEPQIYLNGFEVTDAQSMAVRVAITSFHQEMGDADALGDDSHGRQMVKAYRERLGEVLKLMLDPPT